jgi:threonine aldolase
MRQAGIIAAGALFALEHNIDRLAEDHANAKLLGEAVRRCRGLKLMPEQIDTNIVIFRIDQELGTAAEFVEKLEAADVFMYDIGPQSVRAVTHLDVSREQIERAGEAIQQVAKSAK